jgi:hypothetical protein
MLKNLPGLSFRGAAGDEESRKSFDSRARFLSLDCGIGMIRHLTDWQGLFSILLKLSATS